MKKFLESVAGRFAGRASLDRVCFVFPNRRAATFFKRDLGRAARRPVFVPHVLTIDELFVRIAGLGPAAGKVRLLDVLYREYIRLMPRPEGEEPEPFDRFISWGDILLGDFDDLDKYLVDVRRLLVNLGDLKRLTTDYTFLTDTQKDAIAAFCNSFYAGTSDAGIPQGSRYGFSQLWDILYPLYEAFRARLTERGEAYPGMIYRQVAEGLQAGGVPMPEVDEFVFVGLNALNACERCLLDHLQKEGRADFYWDYSGPMVTDPNNLASRFLRENVVRYPSKEPFDCPALPPDEQRFEVIRVPSAVGQTRKAMQILRQLQQQGAMAAAEETAVVLPDENLLFPMLGAVPETVGRVNVTMGYSLSASSGATLFQLLERLQAGCRERSGGRAYYHRDVTDLLEHPYFAAAADPQALQQLRQSIRSRNLIYVPEAELTDCGGIFAAVFRPVATAAVLPGYLRAILEAVQENQNPLEREFIFHCHKAVSELEQADLDLDALEPKTWYRLLAQYTALVKIPFEGEPLSGLQIMGPLETRALDFENVIMLSVGEGIFPSRTVSASMIPYNLRRGFGLPTYEQQDAIWAYYFYRSICRAKRIYLLYDSRTEGLQSGEESRYIKQLRYLYAVPMTEKVATYALSADGMTADLPQVEKDAAVLAELEQRYFIDRKPFSASALNTYLDCPLRFYYQCVKGIKEAEEVVEELDAGLFGSIYHRVMEQLYKPFKGGELRPSDLEKLRKDSRTIYRQIQAAFAEKKIPEIEGKNLILRDLIRHFVQRTLEIDAMFGKTVPLHLLETEKDARWDLPLSDGRTVRLYGIIDRTDSQEPGIVRIVDYKSGNVNKKDGCGQVDRLFETQPGGFRASVAFQLYLYVLMETRSAGNSAARRFVPCIYSLRDLFSDDLPVSQEITDEQLDAYQTRLTETIESIFDPEIPFRAAADSKTCEYCNFKKLCNRQ